VLEASFRGSIEKPQAARRQALVATIRDAHETICRTGHFLLTKAFAAGQALNELRPTVGYGEWGLYLQRHCGVNARTAQVYMQLAEHREAIEAQAQHAADLSLRAALKLIPHKPGSGSESGKSHRPASAKTMPLSTLAWANSTPEQRQHFVNGIGLQSLLAAIPPQWFSELERRIDGQRARATNSNTELDAVVSKALRQALSLQQSASNKDNASAGVAAALNAINNKLRAAGFDLNDADVVIRAAGRAA